MNLSEIHDLLTAQLRVQAVVVGRVMQDKKLRFAYILPALSKRGLELTINFNTGKPVATLVSFEELQVSKQDWENYLPQQLPLDGSLYDVKGGLLSLKDIYKTCWVATGDASVILHRVLSTLQGGVLVEETAHVHSVISPHVTGDALVTIERSESNGAAIYNASENYLYSRKNCKSDNYAQTPHFYWHVLIEGVKHKLELVASDKLFDNIDLSEDVVNSLTHMYGNILAAFMSRDAKAVFQFPKGSYRFVPNQELKPKSASHHLELELKKAIGDSVPTDMVKRLRRVEKIMPYLEKQGMKATIKIYKLPVFELTPKMEQFQKVYVGLNFVIGYDKEKNSYTELLNTRKGHTLEQFANVLRHLGVNPATKVFVEALYLNKRLPQV